MPEESIKHVTIIGTGLIGGTIGLALQKAYPNVEIAGVGRRESTLEAARGVGALTTAHLDPTEIVDQSDVVILATPVRAFEGYLEKIKDLLKPGCLVTDVGSTKADVVDKAERILGGGGPFVGSHPMAGNENKGPEFADTSLLDGALCIVTPTEQTPGELTDRAEDLWRALGMRTIRLDPVRHDDAVARVSHLPHILSCLLMAMPDDEQLQLAATGFGSMTRLAGGDPEMWRDIVLTNPEPILEAMNRYSDFIKEFAELLGSGDGQAVERFFTECRDRRRDSIGDS
jgi:prephenate dehydrogenase